MKDIIFTHTTQKDIKSFPERAKRKAGYELMAVQMGMEPVDWKPMPTIGTGVREIRIHEGGEHRIIYIAKFEEAVYVLHAFTKKTQRTPKKEIELARKRFSQLQRERENT